MNGPAAPARDEFTARRPIAGWRVVATCFALAIYAWGLGFYGLSVYVQYLAAGDGRSPALLSAATTFYFVLGAGAMAWLERLSSRLSWRALSSAGVVTMAAAAAMLALVPGVAPLFVAYALLALGWAACSGTAISQIVGRWFVLRRGLALSLALTGASFGGILIVPLMVAATGAAGPAAGIAGTAAALALPMLALLWRNLPEPHPASHLPTDPALPHASAPAATPGDRGRLAWVCVLFATGWFAQVAFLSLQIPILAPRVGATDAAAAVSLTTISAIAGRLVLGAVIDRADHRLLTAASFLLQAAGMAVLLASDTRLAAFAGCALFGFSVGNTITLPAAFAQHAFDRARYGAVIARVWTTGQLAFAFGPICAGAAMQASGAVWPVLAGCAACQLAAAAMCPAAGRPTASARSGPAAS